MIRKSLIITATTLLIFAGCTEEKKKDESVKQEVKVEQAVQNNTQKDNIQTSSQNETKIVKVDETKTSNDIQNKVVDAETLYKVCASCHGQKGEKEALGKSQIITGWDKNRVIEALNGYKNGSYGGAMKGIMKSHVESKTNEEIEALAVYISNLN